MRLAAANLYLAGVLFEIPLFMIPALASERVHPKPMSPPSEARQGCEGLLCWLTPNSMATPITAAEAYLVAATDRPSTPVKKKAAKRKTSVAAKDEAVASGRSVNGDTTATSGPTQTMDGQGGRPAIFSLFDPVTQPGDYARWLRRIPRAASIQQARSLPLPRPT